MDLKTIALWSRAESTSRRVGASIASRAITWSKWFCTTSRSAPTSS
jgi:hypothetical protein